MSVTVTPRALDVLRRALAAARLDPSTHGVRIAVARGLRGEEVRTGFSDAPEESEEVVSSGGVRLFIERTLAERNVTVDVSAEHDQIIVR